MVMGFAVLEALIISACKARIVLSAGLFFARIAFLRSACKRGRMVASEVEVDENRIAVRRHEGRQDETRLTRRRFGRKSAMLKCWWFFEAAATKEKATQE